MEAKGRAWRLAAVLCGLVVLLDQAAKAIAQSALVPGEDYEFFPGLSFTNVHNEGVAFGLAGGGGTGLVLITVAALALILVFFARNAERPGLWVPVGLLAGGAFGNLADRVRIDSVTDFIDLPLWPAFNLADVAIVAGVAGLVLIYLDEPQERGA
ncbi:MAG: signal peptidase II [Actinomycetota bacterium]